MDLLIALAIGMLFATGVFQILRRNVIRSVIGLMILTNAVNLFLICTGASDSLEPPYVIESAGVLADAFPQALVLTAIVISMGGTALVLSMLYIISARYKTSDMDKINGLKN